MLKFRYFLIVISDDCWDPLAGQSPSPIINICQSTLQLLVRDPDLWDVKLFYGIKVWSFDRFDENIKDHLDKHKYI